jgi:hypothetical protein
MSALSLFGTESWSDYGQVVLRMAMLVTSYALSSCYSGWPVKVVRMTDRPGTLGELLDSYPRWLMNRAEGDLSLEGQCKLSGLPAVPCPSPSLRTGKPSPNSHLAAWGRREDSEIEGPD